MALLCSVRLGAGLISRGSSLCHNLPLHDLFAGDDGLVFGGDADALIRSGDHARAAAGGDCSVVRTALQALPRAHGDGCFDVTCACMCRRGGAVSWGPG